MGNINFYKIIMKTFATLALIGAVSTVTIKRQADWDANNIFNEFVVEKENEPTVHLVQIRAPPGGSPTAPSPPTKEKVSPPLKPQEWEKTGQLNHMVIMKVPQPMVDITPVCTIMNQATNGLIHTMIHLIKTSISETVPSCHQIETLEKWLLLRSTTP